ncbi:MAG: hypothetical protein FIA99_03575 [Ruminiclostridium sp.]|nr:hypothetical protein [Ruminiclostridium sp.]
MTLNSGEMVLINKALLLYKNVLHKSSEMAFVQENTINDQVSQIKINHLLEKLEIELYHEDEDIVKCDECLNQIKQNEDIFIDKYSFNVNRSLVVCCDCYENIYKHMDNNRE